jgi:hypothetical protein
MKKEKTLRNRANARKYRKQSPSRSFNRRGGDGGMGAQEGGTIGERTPAEVMG